MLDEHDPTILSTRKYEGSFKGVPENDFFSILNIEPKPLFTGTPL